MYKKFFIVFGIAVLFATNIFAVKPAQTEWGIQYKMIPERPEPGDLVFLDIFSYSIDLDSSNILFILNGELKEAGTGKKEFNFQIPDNKKELKVKIIAKDFNGKIEQREIVIKPASVDLIYEVVNPYRPVFYKGKSTALSHSKVKFFAFPNFFSYGEKRLDSNSLIYTWKVNGNIMSGSSGVGKDTFLIDKVYGVPRETRVEVMVRNLDGGMKALKTIILEPKFSNIDFYLDNKVMPFRFKSVAKSNLISDYLDSDIVAIPYFFNDIESSKINWIINNNKINLLSWSNPLRMNIIKNEKNILADLNISLTIENEDRALQAANSDIKFYSSESLIERYKKIREKKERQEKIKNSGNNFFGL